jgi:single-strand DNA-binding protein
MNMQDSIVVSGLVATTPRFIKTSEGLAIASFRLASAQKRIDPVTGEVKDTDTNWYTVSAFGQLAENMAKSIEKGTRVIVSGRLRIRDWESTDRSGTTVEIEANIIGHDLNWGTSEFTRVSAAELASV